MAQLSWLLPLVAYWSVWTDYAARIQADPQSSAHPVAALAGLAVLWRRAPRAQPMADRVLFVLSLISACTFALAFAQLTAMPRCLLALLGTGASVAWQRGSARPVLGLCLLLLALPALGQLEHLIGFSLRHGVAEATAALLRATNLPVGVDGTRLAWAGGLVDVDAPCSGLRMLWTGTFVALLAIARFELRAHDALFLLLAAPVFLLLANVLRCAALFYVEAGIVGAPEGAHAGVGLVVFGVVCAALWESARRLEHRRPTCAVR